MENSRGWNGTTCEGVICKNIEIYAISFGNEWSIKSRIGSIYGAGIEVFTH